MRRELSVRYLTGPVSSPPWGWFLNGIMHGTPSPLSQCAESSIYGDRRPPGPLRRPGKWRLQV